MVLAVAAQMILLGRKMQSFDTSMQNVAELQNNMSVVMDTISKRSKELNNLEINLQRVNILYTEMLKHSSAKAKDAYTIQMSDKDWKNHDSIHRAENRVYRYTRQSPGNNSGENK